MIASVGYLRSLQTTSGRFNRAKCQFISSDMLTGKLLEFAPGMFTDIGTPKQKPFKIKYPPSAGNYEFTNLGAYNYRAYLEVIDAYNFEIWFDFFAGEDLNGWVKDVNHNASSVFDNSQINDVLGFHVEANEENETTGIPIEINDFCQDGLVFQLIGDGGRSISGFTPGEDLKIRVLAPNSVSNNIEVGFYRKNAVANDTDVVSGLALSYALINNGNASQIQNINNTAIIGGSGFNSNGTSHEAIINIDGDVLHEQGVYKLYVIYQNKGVRSCISQDITQGAIKPAIVPNVNVSISDSFGNSTTEDCVRGLSIYSPVSIYVEINKSDFNTILSNAGLTGDFDDYFESARLIIKGGTFQVINDATKVRIISDYTAITKGLKLITARFTFNYGSHRDFIEKTLQINFNALETTIEPDLVDSNSESTDEICSEVGGNYQITNAASSCRDLVSINGGEYFESAIIENQTLDTDLISVGDQICVKKVCAGTPETQNECDDVTTYKLTVTGFGGGGGSFVLDGTYVQITYEINGVETVYPEFEMLHYDTVTIVESEDEIIVTDFQVEVRGSQGDAEYKIEEETISGDCDENDDLVCLNTAGFDISCDEENQIITIAVIEDISSSVESFETLCSIDGAAPVPCPSSIAGEEKVFITHDVIFSDGCPPLHIEQNIVCKKNTFCINSRDVVLSIVSDQLDIAITDNFESTVVEDILKVSLDGGSTFETYDQLDTPYTPVDVDGDESIIVTWQVKMLECQNVEGFETLNLIPEIDESQCDTDYSAYGLSVIYDPKTKLYTVSKTGDESELEENELKWAFGVNPFDNNGTGVHYTIPVPGQGLFIATWRIKKENCPTVDITTLSYGYNTVQIDGLVTARITDIVTECWVTCCAVDFILVCENGKLIIESSDDLTGYTISWSGPNNFSQSGGMEITLPAVSGLYTAEITGTANGDPCVSKQSYYHNQPSAGTDSGSPVTVN